MPRLPILLTLVLVACTETAPEGAGRDAGAPSAPVVAVPAPPPSPAPVVRPPPVEAARPRIEAAPGDTLQIPAGPLRVGSLPGTPERRPSVEADLVSIEMPSVDIDRLPYPNDPARPLQLAGTRAEASGLCEARGRRLCDELEWERACRGASTDRFPTGSTLDIEACASDPGACPSVTGALEMGIQHGEWTASVADERLGRLERTSVVRGAWRDAALHEHACGVRHVHNPEGGGRALAFRCCGGPPPSVEYPDVGLRRLYRDLDWDDARYQEVLRQIPELASFADGFTVYGGTEAMRVLGRGGAGLEDLAWELTRAPFAWSPSPGEELFVFAGSSGERSMIAAIYPLPDGTFRHGASFLFEDEAAPIAILRTRTNRNELIWSTCWGCMGESGVVRFSDDATIVIAQQ